MSPVLRADCVSYATQGRTLLRKVALDLHSGEVLAVVGPNGAGKSTLCGVLAGDIAPTEGVIEVCGLPLRATKTTTLARLRSMLIQNTHMRFPFTAREVTLMGRYPYLSRWRSPTEADFAIVEGAMQNTEVLHLAERVYPTLSGGEQRRVSLARVLAQDTPVILLDEPTTALDIGHQQLVMSLCRKLASEGRAVLAVLHDLNLASAYADRIIVMLEGEVVMVGSPEEVICSDLLSDVFNHQVMVVPHPQTDKPVVLASFSRSEDRQSTFPCGAAWGRYNPNRKGESYEHS